MKRPLLKNRIRKHFMNESALDSFVVNDNNVVCIQCMFKKLLMNKDINIFANYIQLKSSNSFDFEVYYNVDASTMKKLLNTTIFATNIKDCPFVPQDDTIVEILKKMTPIAAHLTDSKQQNIAAAQLSNTSAKILKQLNCQRDNVSAFRFSCPTHENDIVFADLYSLKDNYKILDPTSYKSILSNGELKYLYIKDEQKMLIPQKINMYVPFIIAGYWNVVNYNSEKDIFAIDKSNVIRSDLATPLAKYDNDMTQMMYNYVNDRTKIADTGVVDFIKNAYNSAIKGGNVSKLVKVDDETNQIVQPKRLSKTRKISTTTPGYKPFNTDDHGKYNRAAYVSSDPKGDASNIHTYSDLDHFMSYYAGKIALFKRKLDSQDRKLFEKLYSILEKYNEDAKERIFKDYSSYEDAGDENIISNEPDRSIIQYAANIIGWCCSLDQNGWAEHKLQIFNIMRIALDNINNAMNGTIDEPDLGKELKFVIYESKVDFNSSLANAKKLAKNIDTPQKVKDFLEKYEDKILFVQSKLKGETLDKFNKIVEVVEKYSKENVNEAAAKSKKSKINIKKIPAGLVYATVALIAWLCGWNQAMWIALSPFTGPFIDLFWKRVSGMK